MSDRKRDRFDRMAKRESHQDGMVRMTYMKYAAALRRVDKAAWERGKIYGWLRRMNCVSARSIRSHD